MTHIDEIEYLFDIEASKSFEEYLRHIVPDVNIEFYKKVSNENPWKEIPIVFNTTPYRNASALIARSNLDWKTGLKRPTTSTIMVNSDKAFFDIEKNSFIVDDIIEGLTPSILNDGLILETVKKSFYKEWISSMIHNPHLKKPEPKHQYLTGKVIEKLLHPEGRPSALAIPKEHGRFVKK